LSKEGSQIKELLAEYSRIIQGESRVKALHDELATLKMRLETLAQQVEKEHLDVIRLEKPSLRYVFKMILRDREEQLEKERQEYLLAVVEHTECKDMIGILNYELDVIKHKIQTKDLVLRALERALDESTSDKVKADSPYYRDFSDANKDVKRLHVLEAETKEALQVTNELEEHFVHMVRYLNQAKEYDNWGSFYEERKKGRELKKSFIDKAKAELQVIKMLVVYLRDELKDVEVAHAEFKRSEVIIRNFNISYYRHLIDDWIKSSDLQAVMTNTLSASKAIVKLSRSLEKLIASLEGELEHTLEKREQLVRKMIGD